MNKRFSTPEPAEWELYRTTAWQLGVTEQDDRRASSRRKASATMRTLATLVVLMVAAVFFLDPLALLADVPADPQVAADQAAAAVALAHVAELKAPAEAQLLEAQAAASAADTALGVQERTAWLALDASLRQRMNDLRVFGLAFLLGVVTVSLPALVAVVLFRLLLGSGWQGRLFGKGSAHVRLAVWPAPSLPPAHGGHDSNGQADTASQVQRGSTGA